MAESFGMDCEIHGNGAANLAVVGAIKNCTWYERGLLHPFLDYDEVPAYLKRLVDPMDEDGYVHLSNLPGLGKTSTSTTSKPIRCKASDSCMAARVAACRPSVQ